MSTKRKLIIVCMIIVVIVVSIGMVIRQKRDTKRTDVKVPILLYHNFVTTVPDKPMLITFDDGYYSNHEYIYPILKKYQVKASIFVVTDKIGQEIDGIKYLGWEECLEMQNSNLIEILE